MAAVTAPASSDKELKSDSALTNASFEPPERPKITTRQTLVLAFLSLGVIYGDVRALCTAQKISADPLERTDRDVDPLHPQRNLPGGWGDA